MAFCASSSAFCSHGSLGAATCFLGTVAWNVSAVLVTPHVKTRIRSSLSNPLTPAKNSNQSEGVPGEHRFVVSSYSTLGTWLGHGEGVGSGGVVVVATVVVVVGSEPEVVVVAAVVVVDAGVVVVPPPGSRHS